MTCRTKDTIHGIEFTYQNGVLEDTPQNRRQIEFGIQHAELSMKKYKDSHPHLYKVAERWLKEMKHMQFLIDDCDSKRVL